MAVTPKFAIAFYPTVVLPPHQTHTDGRGDPARHLPLAASPARGREGNQALGGVVFPRADRRSCHPDARGHPTGLAARPAAAPRLGSDGPQYPVGSVHATSHPICAVPRKNEKTSRFRQPRKEGGNREHGT